MNIAVQALAIFLLALPGIILRKTYRRGTFHEAPRASRPIAEEIAYSLVLACILHAAWAGIADLFFWPVDLEAATLLLLGQYGHDSSLLPNVVGSLTSHPYRILTYFVSLCVLAYGLGYISHVVVRWRHWDERWSLFRFDHPWHYLLSAIPGDYDLVFVSFVMDTSDGSFLYVGILDSYHFKGSEINLFVVSDAARRRLDSSPSDSKQEGYYLIEVDHLCIKYSEVKDVGVRPVVLTRDEELSVSA